MSERPEHPIRLADKLLRDALEATIRNELEIAACWTAGALAVLNQILDRHSSHTGEDKR